METVVSASSFIRAVSQRPLTEPRITRRPPAVRRRTDSEGFRHAPDECVAVTHQPALQSGMVASAPGREPEAALSQALATQGITLALCDMSRFARLIKYALEARERGPRRLPDPRREILHWIEAARDSGDRREAVWRSFIAAVFGRLSSRVKDGSAAGAADFLCAFGYSPVWTWERVNSDQAKALREWMDKTPQAALFPHGDHRPREPLTPDRILAAVRSFIDFARKVNGPENVIKAAAPSSPEHHFALLFDKFRKLHSFKRLGSWDLIDLLLQVKLVLNAEPEHCYLEGSTGPLRGARMIWGSKPSPSELNRASRDLARALRVSCFVLEDALCNFQKPGEPCCGDPDAEARCE